MSTRNYARGGETIVKTFPAKGGVVFNPGEIIMLRLGIAEPGSTDVELLPAGVCARKLDTTGAADGDLRVEAEYSGYFVEVDNSVGMGAVLSTDENANLYTLDANAVSTDSSGKSKFGIFKGFSSSGRVRVLVDPN